MDYSSSFGDVQACTNLLNDLLDALIQININHNTKNLRNKGLSKWLATTIYVHNFSKFDSIFLTRTLFPEREEVRVSNF
jgi:hypothetical protein